MRVSWLIPIRDAERWIHGCLESVLADCSEVDEVIVVDDGSNIEQRRFFPVDPRIRYFRQQANGIVAALEQGRAMAVGRYIARMDGDDFNIAGRLNAQVAYLEENPSCGTVGGKALLFSELDTENEGMQRYVKWVNSIRNCDKALFIESPMFHPATLIPRHILDQVGGYRDGDFPEDYELWLRIANHGYDLYNLDQPVVRIRDHGQRLTRNDTRYRKKAFLHLKKEYLPTHLKKKLRHVGIWGAGKGAKPWIAWLRQRGYSLSIFDSFAKGNRHGIPILEPQALVNSQIDYLFVAVGARGAKPLISAFLSETLDWKEGEPVRHRLGVTRSMRTIY